jgi:thymidylate kinase
MARLGARIRWDLARGRLVVVDRHPIETALAPGGRAAAAKRALLRAAVPAPDVTLLLDAPAELMFARKGEHDVFELQRQRDRYRALAETIGGHVVDAARPADEVRRRATAIVWNAYASRT